MGASYADDLIRVKILSDRDRSFQIRVGMKNKDRVEMLLLFVQNVDAFVWSPYEAPGVDLEFIVHRLNVGLLFLPKKQKPRRSAKEDVEAIKQEVKRLKEEGAINEVFFPR